MKSAFGLLMIVVSASMLSGCVPMMAVSAVSMAARSAEGRPVSNEALQPQARKACSAFAAQFGTVNVIDVEQHRIDKIIVWGTVDDGTGKMSFQCEFGTKISRITWRPITPQR
jgi:hypothetical protein